QSMTRSLTCGKISAESPEARSSGERVRGISETRADTGAGRADREDRTDLAADRRPDPAADMSAGRRKSRFCLQRKAALPWRGRLFLQWAFSLRFAAWAPSLQELC